jgi:hypothetical protein
MSATRAAVERLWKRFVRPPVEFRSAPFWALNDDLHIPELKRQLSLMVRGGMQGGFLHSREGLVTPYLSPAWNAAVRACVEHAKKLGTPVYLYDEDRWPSGFAGGRIRNARRHAMQFLRIKHPSRTFSYRIAPMEPDPWFNNTGFLDEANPEAVRAFIEAGYEPYRRLLGCEFGRTIRGMFTDEPQYFLHPKLSVCTPELLFPWTRDLPRLFKERWGYDIEPRLESLLRPVGDYRTVRYHYYRLLHERFRDSFGRQVHAWCRAHRIPLVGHYDNEDTLTAQASVIGAAMPLYRHMDIPGVDHLARQVHEQVLSHKQVASAARQTGKRRVLSELFGIGGQNLSFEDRTWIGNFNCVLGVNFFVPHLWLYSMAGERKRDFPPTLSYQQPYWPDNRLLEDYFARVNWLLSQGTAVCRIGIIHPIETVWCIFDRPELRRSRAYDRMFDRLLKGMLGAQMDFDLIDESLLEELGSVSGEGLAVGRMTYRIIVVPPVVTLRRNTLSLLQRYVDAGGLVVVMGTPPERVEGVRSDRALARAVWERAVRVSGGRDVVRAAVCRIDAAARAHGVRDVSVETVSGGAAPSVWYQRRTVEEADVFFFVNTDREREYDLRITLHRIVEAERKALLWWNARDGTRCLLWCTRCADGFVVPVRLPRAGSCLLAAVPEDAVPEGLTVRDALPRVLQTGVRIGGWKAAVSSETENILTMDECRFRCGMRGTWSASQYVLDVRAHFGREVRDGTPFSLQYRFRTELSRRPRQVHLVVEHPEQYRVTVNGVRVPARPAGFLRDHQFKRLDITRLVALRGDNVVQLEGVYRHPTVRGTYRYVRGGTEIESVYVAGDFSVFAGRCERIVTPRGRSVPITIEWLRSVINRDSNTGVRATGGFVLRDLAAPRPADVVSSGFPFFAGEMTFTGVLAVPRQFIGRRLLLRAARLRSIVARVCINGRQVGSFGVPPHELDISDVVRPGENEITVTVVTSLRNMLGPHHLPLVEPQAVGTWSFSDREHRVDGYAFVNVGVPALEVVEARGSAARSG